jgi:hypothetical protein
MAKTKPKRIQNGALNRPTVEEVFQYINSYMTDWPEKFCRIISEKFCDHYSANGWKIGGKSPMKDFEAAFRSQWKTPKDINDKKLLEQLQMEPVHQARIRQQRQATAGIFAPVQDQVENAAKIDLKLIALSKLQDKVIAGQHDVRTLWVEYDGLKRMGIMKVPKEQIDQIMILKGESNERGKSLMVEYLFRNLTHAGLTVRQFFYQIHTHATKKADDLSGIRQDERQG